MAATHRSRTSRIRLVLVALAVMLVAVACKVDTTVTVTVHDDGSGVVGSTLPIGQDCVAASGSALRTAVGVKLNVPLGGSVTHPWPPVYFATRADPPGTLTLTVWAVRSTTGFPIFVRLAYGAVNHPTFSAAKSRSSPVMNTAEHIVLARPEASCDSASPGGGA